MRNFTRATVAQAVAVLVALVSSLAFAGLLITLNGNYGAQGSDEILTRSAVQEITYGVTVESSTTERPESSTGGKCFLTMESGATHALKLAQCSINVGDSISLLTKTDGSERLTPEYHASEIFTIHMYLILSGITLLGSLFALALIAYRSKFLEEHRAIDEESKGNAELLALSHQR